MIIQDSARSFGKWFAVGTDPLEVLLRPGGLSVLFQPIVDLRPRGRLLHSLECLARGPMGTPLEHAPDLFAYVRARGAEVEVDRACVSVALRAAALVGDAPRFTINVHASTLASDPRFTQFIVEQLVAAGLRPAQLIVDLLAPHAPGDKLCEAVDQLRAVGIGIAFDDVGLHTTDYEVVARCRADYLKLDHSLVRRSSADDLRDLMLDSVARLARGMGAQTVAEGIETLDELDTATGHGVNLVQGHFFGEPMTGARLVDTGLLRAA